MCDFRSSKHFACVLACACAIARVSGQGLGQQPKRFHWIPQ